MNKTLTVAVLSLALAAPLVAGDTREIRESYDLEAGQEVWLDFPIGSLEVEAWEGEQVTVEIEARCRNRSRRCEQRLEEIEVSWRPRRGRLAVEVESKRSWRGGELEIDAVIRVPRRAALTVDMGIGELEVSGFENDVRIDMGIGEVGVRMAESSVRSVSLDAGIGESRLDGVGRVNERRRLLIGSELDWNDGEGRADVEVDLGIGEISVRLG